LLILANPVAAAALNAPNDREFRSVWRPKLASFGDLLVNVLLNVCAEQSFWPSFLNVFHMLSQHVFAFSVETANRTMGFLEQILRSENGLRFLILESLAGMIQSPEIGRNGFLIAIVQKRDWFGQLGDLDAKSSKALIIIIEVLNIVPMDWNGSDDLSAVLANAQASSGEHRVFSIHPYRFQGEMCEKWRDWIDLLFVRSFRREVELMREYQEESESVLVDALLAAKAAS
jgi:hypothetical protein